MARQAAQLIVAALLALAAPLAAANDPRTPQTSWSSLSPEQQRILGPVASDWDRMPGFQQQRLMSAAKQYPSLQPIQKERFEQRIRDWSSMTPEQRRAARETFQGMRKLPPEKQHELRERWLQRQEGQQQRGPYGPQQQYAPQQQYGPPQYQSGERQQYSVPGQGPQYQGGSRPAEPGYRQRGGDPSREPRGR